MGIREGNGATRRVAELKGEGCGAREMLGKGNRARKERNLTRGRSCGKTMGEVCMGRRVG